MGYKACFAANSPAIGKKYNAVDRPNPRDHGPRGVVQSFPEALPLQALFLHANPDPHRRDRLKLLENLAKLCAVLAGALLTAITLMTCASLIGRNTTGATIVGDFELTGVATGAAIALF